MFKDNVQLVRAWMFEQALPLWGDIGIDRVHGGYCEQFKTDATPDDPGYKRIRVIARQIYVFSHAYCLGWQPGLALAEHGYRFLTEKAWLGDDSGWARRLDTQGNVIDPTADLYDNAFALFALAWFHRASGNADAIAWALRTVDYITTHLRHENGIGFLHEKPPIGPRQQNPHMHLLEAALACLETAPQPKFEALALEVVSLFQTKLFSQHSARLPEYFDEEMVALDNEQGRITEPGHQFEWAWILANTHKLLGLDTKDTARALIRTAEQDGVDPVTFVTYNQVRDDGVALDKGSRTWPNTERIKAHIAAYELFGDDPRQAISDSIDILFARYLKMPVKGTWIDAFDGNGAPKYTAIPASTLYHVFLAFAEVLRVADQIEKDFPA
jgi:mannose/cellobiose epimerase-like protein (N-acyl-D-glucosamine 2-epimerase family)